MKGPFFRLFVFCGRKFSFGRLTSKPKQPQALRLSNAGCSEVIATWTPRLPWGNVFHEERYVRALRVGEAAGEGAAEEPWREDELPAEDVEEVNDGKQLRLYIDQLPVNVPIELRVCAVNCWGRSEWSDVARGHTCARPVDGGFTGPLGPAGQGLGEGRHRYRWTQTRGEVTLKVPVGADWPTRDIRFKATPGRIEIYHAAKARGSSADAPPPAEAVLLAGSFPKRVKADEVFWEIDENEREGRHIAVQMAKSEAMDKWPCLIEGDGHPRIDVRMVRILTQEMDVLGRSGIDLFE